MAKKLPQKAFTGFFRDGVKRIDLVLVINDDGDGKVEMLRVNFLSNIVKTGLQIEIEQGVKEKNKNLLFVKIHAPASVIMEYGEYFHARRFFKESHADFVNPQSFRRHKRNEKELLKVIRWYSPGPLNYSTLERSTIVYKILLMLPFGFFENYFGLTRLLENKIILDAYPLHDGPYFYVHDQDPIKVNGRQVLYHTWSNCCKILLGQQPYSLIHEYLGQRVAFYFAFLDYYIKGLLITSVLSILLTLTAVCLPDKLGVMSFSCKNATSVTVCGVCVDIKLCPHRAIDDYCHKTYLLHVTDSVPIACFCLLLGLASIIFIVLWQRRTSYLNWLWEIDLTYARKVVRAEFMISKRWSRSALTFKHCLLFLFNFVIYAAYFLLAVALASAVMNYKHWLLHVTFGSKVYWKFYIILVLIGLLNFCFATLMRFVNRRLTYTLTNYENQRTYTSHEGSYVWKLFIFNMFCYSPLVFFYAYRLMFATGRAWFPEVRPKAPLIYRILFLNCGPYGCGDEMLVILILMILLKEFLIKIPMRLRTKSDYTTGTSESMRLPCWEREYELDTLNEDSLDVMYLNITLQIALGLFFVQTFTLAPLFMLCAALWDNSYYASYILKGCRRPLVRNTSGIGAWQQVIVSLGYAVPFFNALCVAWSSEAIERLMFHFVQTEPESNLQIQYYKKYYHTYYDFVMSKNEGETCKYPVMCRDYLSFNRYWQPKHLKWWFIFFYQHFVVLFALLLLWLIPRYRKDIKQTLRTENYITSRYNLAKGVTD